MMYMQDMLPWNKNEQNHICSANVFNESIKTTVEGIESDGCYKLGRNSFPIFDVTEHEFKSNMEASRQRCRFTTEKVAKFSRQNRITPFYIRWTDEATGKAYIRRVK